MRLFRRTLIASHIALSCLLVSRLSGLELTLDEVLDRASSASHESIVSQAAIDIVDARLQRSQELLPSNPFVGFSYWDSTGTTFSGDRQRGIGPSYTLSLSQTFEIAGQRGKRVEANRQSAEVARANARASRANLTAGVRRTFNDTIEAHARTGFAFETLHWQRELARTYANSSEAARNQAQMRVVRAEGEYDASKHVLFLHESRLRQILTLPSDEPLVLVGDLSDEIVSLPALEPLIAYAMDNRADLAAHRRALASDDAALDLARRRAIPDLTLSGFVSHSDTSRDDVQFGASVGLPLPVFRGSGPDVAEALAARTRAHADLSNMEMTIEREVREARYATLVAALDVERIKTSVLDLADRNVELAEATFERGTGGVWDLVNAEIERVQARREYTSALRIYNNAIVELERVLGGSLDEVGQEIGQETTE